MKTSFRRTAGRAFLFAACLSVGGMAVGCELAVQLDVEGIQGESDGSAPCPICLDGAVVTERDGNVVIVFGAAEAGDAPDGTLEGAATAVVDGGPEASSD